jgi:hypothetical protein
MIDNVSIVKTTIGMDGLSRDQVVSPTADRWQEVRHGGTSAMLGSVDPQGKTVIFADQSSSPTAPIDRDIAMELLVESGKPLPDVLFLTKQSQEEVALHMKRAGIPDHVVDGVFRLGYAAQRQQADLLTAAKAVEGGEVHQLSLDDDLVFPKRRVRIRKCFLTSLGFDPLPNSQLVVHRNGERDNELFIVEDALSSPNSTHPFFMHLGKRVGDVSGLDERTSRGWVDTMHDAFPRVQPHSPQQFVVDYEVETSAETFAQAKIIGATATKQKRPDYRTIEYTRRHFLDEFGLESPIQAFPSGESVLFGFVNAHTNVDSANFSRLFDDKTAFFPWWYNSDTRISSENPLKVVLGQYRADNELLPVLLTQIEQIFGDLYVYVSGLGVQIEHYRSQMGYRPNLLEQATGSLIGNIAAMEASTRFEKGPEGYIVIKRDGLQEGFRANRALVQKSFDELLKLRNIALNKIRDIAENDPKRSDLIVMYRRMIKLINRKTAGEDFNTFYQHISEEVRRQTLFYADVVDNMPKMILEVRKLLKKGQYPVEKAVLNT